MIPKLNGYRLNKTYLWISYSISSLSVPWDATQLYTLHLQCKVLKQKDKVALTKLTFPLFPCHVKQGTEKQKTLRFQGFTEWQAIVYWELPLLVTVGSKRG